MENIIQGKVRRHLYILGKFRKIRGEGSLKMNLCQIRLWHLFSSDHKKRHKINYLGIGSHFFYRLHILFVWHICVLLQCSLNHLIRVLSHVMTLIMVLNILSCIYFNEEHLMCLLLIFQQCYNWENCCL